MYRNSRDPGRQSAPRLKFFVSAKSCLHKSLGDANIAQLAIRSGLSKYGLDVIP